MVGVLRAVAVVGRLVARHLDDGRALEVTRIATDGVRNANSLLCMASWRVAKALGHARPITCTQAGESGASLCAVGWTVLARCRPRCGRHCASRPRASRGTDHVARTPWEASASGWRGGGGPSLPSGGPVH
ncbi:XF1762 family protein [Kitasatospora phosalacinea]|uniref:XF1762 family protein n=1 Tax=Kitasatospora phosalacinea TaxID=2065 RepID=UPI0036535884